MNPLINPARFKPAVRSGGGSIEFGITQLVNGQAYIDVVLVTTLTDTIWDTVCSVVNTTDATPLNIWPGMITAKSTTGFTVQLNGAPDSANYFLHWTIIPGASVPVAVATTYHLSGPSSGATAVASTPFTVQLISGQTVPAPVTVTPGDGGGGTFTPATVNLTTAAPSATFTYTPASAGAKTISVTNSGGLTNPGNLTYTVTAGPFDPTAIAGLKLWLKADALALSDGAAVATWPDSSGLGNNATQATSAWQPVFKTNIVNSKPVLRFASGVSVMGASMLGSISTAGSLFIVQLTRNIGTSAQAITSTPGSPSNSFAVYLPYSDANIYFDLGDSTATGRVSAAWGGDLTHFFAWSFVAGGGNMGVYRNGTTVVSSGGHTNSFNPAGLTLAINGPTGGVTAQDADIAEILIYNTALSTTDRQNVENYLRTKYGLP